MNTKKHGLIDSYRNGCVTTNLDLILEGLVWTSMNLRWESNRFEVIGSKPWKYFALHKIDRL